MTTKDIAVAIDAELPDNVKQVLGKTVRETVDSKFHDMIPQEILDKGFWGEPSTKEYREIIRLSSESVSADKSPAEKVDLQEQVSLVTLAASLRNKETRKPLLTVEEIGDLPGRVTKVLASVGDYALQVLLAGNKQFQKLVDAAEGKPEPSSTTGS